MFESQALADDIRQNTDYLFSLSYRCPSLEWHESRTRLTDMKGLKSTATRDQRLTDRTIRNMGLIWFF